MPAATYLYHLGVCRGALAYKFATRPVLTSPAVVPEIFGNSAVCMLFKFDDKLVHVVSVFLADTYLL